MQFVKKNLYISLKYIKLDIFCMSIFKKIAKRFKIKKNTFLRDIIFITENANKNNQWKNVIFYKSQNKKINKYAFLIRYFFYISFFTYIFNNFIINRVR